MIFLLLLLQKDSFSFQFMEINENPVLLKLSPLQSSASEVKTKHYMPEKFQPFVICIKQRHR